MLDPIDESILANLVEAGGLDAVRVTRTDLGFHLSVRYARSKDWRSIRSRREPLRTWRSLDTLSGYLERIGVREFSVEL